MTIGLPKSISPPVQRPFTVELQALLNKHSVDDHVGVPDYILAHYVVASIESLRETLVLVSRSYNPIHPPVGVHGPVEFARYLEERNEAHLQVEHEIRMRNLHLERRESEDPDF